MVSISADEARHLAHEAILKQLSEGVVVTDSVGTIQFVNDAATALHGVARLDVRPSAYSATYHLYREDGRPYPSHELPLARAVRGETVKDARWRIRRPNGVEILAIGTAQPLLGPNGRRIGAVLTLRDDSARAAAEEALKASAAALVDARAAQAASEAATQVRTERWTLDGRMIRATLQTILDQTEARNDASLHDVRQHGDAIHAAATALLAIVDRVMPNADHETDTLDHHAA